MSHRVVLLPAGKAEPKPSERFDPCQFYDGHGRLLQGGRVGLDFASLQFMHLHERGRRLPSRRLPTPMWSLSDASLRATILAYLENRFCTRKAKHIGTAEQRLEQVKIAAAQALASRRERLQNLLEKYRELGSQPHAKPLELNRLEAHCRNLDSDVFLTENCAAIVAAVAYYYFRMNWNSVSIAEELGLTSPGVRKILERLNRAEKRLVANAA